jgi:hypothetical protein
MSLRILLLVVLPVAGCRAPGHVTLDEVLARLEDIQEEVDGRIAAETREAQVVKLMRLSHELHTMKFTAAFLKGLQSGPPQDQVDWLYERAKYLQENLEPYLSAPPGSEHLPEGKPGKPPGAPPPGNADRPLSLRQAQAPVVPEDTGIKASAAAPWRSLDP